jgi:hypothetical protein
VAERASERGEGAPARLRICLVASPGGHLYELCELEPFWGRHERFWVTAPGPETAALLAGERVIAPHHPTRRHAGNLVRNAIAALRILRRERPDLVLSTGAGVAVPFIWVARLLGVPTIFVETLARARDLSLTGRLVYRIATRVVVRWPELARRRPRALCLEEGAPA